MVSELSLHEVRARKRPTQANARFACWVHAIRVAVNAWSDVEESDDRLSDDVRFTRAPTHRRGGVMVVSLTWRAVTTLETAGISDMIFVRSRTGTVTAATARAVVVLLAWSPVPTPSAAVVVLPTMNERCACAGWARTAMRRARVRGFTDPQSAMGVCGAGAGNE